MGAWIEMRIWAVRSFIATSHPTMGAWIEIVSHVLHYIYRLVAPHDGCVD